MKWRTRIALTVALIGLAGCRGAWREIPPPEGGAGFELGAGEVTVGEFVRFLNAGDCADFPETTQIRRLAGGRYAARPSTARQAVAEVTPADAEAYCRWLSRASGRIVRLPTEAEWEWAARGGVRGAPYPWGWGGDPRRLAQFATNAPARRGGLFPANGFGLYDMAGNLYEWCALAAAEPATRRVARGGSWAEQDPTRLENGHRQPFAADYSGRDVGFRVLREWPVTE